MATKAPASSLALVELIRESKVLPDSTAKETLAAAADLPEDPVHAATTLVRRGVLTQFQARLLLAGKVRGFRLGDYLLQDQIGKGGMGTVFLAIHQTLGRKVAIKVLPPNAAADRACLERFLREARTAASLDHVNIVKLYDVCKHGETHYLVMEYVQGQTLEALAKNGGIPPAKAVGYVAQAAAGLQHAYEKGFLHRDIKPANLMLAADGTVKILDMGLARKAESPAGVTQQFDEGVVLGTADYVSPEQANNAPGVDIRSDIYSLGATFYALATGSPPFEGSTARKLVQHQTSDPPLLSSLDKTFPPKLAAVVAKMMAKRPADRHRTPADVIVALQPWLSESPSLNAGVSQTKAVKDRLSSRNLKAAADLSKLEREPEAGSRKGLVTAVVLLVAAVAGAASWAYFSGSGAKELALAPKSGSATKPAGSGAAAKPSSSAAGAPKPAVPSGSGGNAGSPNPAPVAAPAPMWVEGKSLYVLDLAKQKPFQLEGSTAGMTNITGPGEVPDGWSIKTWIADHRAKGFAEDAGGAMALGMKPVSGNAILFSPEIDFGTAKFVRLAFEFRSDASERLCTVRFREMGATKTENANLAPGAGWTKFERVYDVSDFKSAIRIEFHDSDKTGEFRIKSFKLTAVERKS